jgi:hypothetical protein
VNKALKKIYQILKPSGYLFIDLPDFFSESGKHHWRKIEHIWFLDNEQLSSILEDIGFSIVKITNPIPGKSVFYCHKNV